MINQIGFLDTFMHQIFIIQIDPKMHQFIWKKKQKRNNKKISSYLTEFQLIYYILLLIIFSPIIILILHIKKKEFTTNLKQQEKNERKDTNRRIWINAFKNMLNYTFKRKLNKIQTTHYMLSFCSLFKKKECVLFYTFFSPFFFW